MSGYEALLGGDVSSHDTNLNVLSRATIVQDSQAFYFSDTGIHVCHVREPDIYLSVHAVSSP